MIRTTTLALVLAASVACGASTPTQPKPFEIGSEFTLAPGQRATSSDQSLEVGFVEVTDDSRCPSDVTCVWAGEVKARILLRPASGRVEETELRAGDSSSVASHTVALVSVSPYPSSKTKIEKKDYRATFKVTASQ